jgi:2-haloacid dehalogenase
MKSTPYSWLLFDADGTLFDYDECERRALAKTLKQTDIPVTERALAAYRRINAALWLKREQGKISVAALKLQRFKTLFEEIGISADPQKFGAGYLENLGGEAVLLDQAAETIERLALDYHLALVTNGLREVQRKRLEKSGLKHLFEAVIISDEIGASKPDVAFFEETFIQIGQPVKSRVLMIGDSLTSDIQGANNFGIDACWVNLNGKIKPSGYEIIYEVNKLSGLIEVLKI